MFEILNVTDASISSWIYLNIHDYVISNYYKSHAVVLICSSKYKEHPKDKIITFDGIEEWERSCTKDSKTQLFAVHSYVLIVPLLCCAECNSTINNGCYYNECCSN